MKNRKDIGRLIEEKLDASNVSGKPELWEQIEQTLDKKKRRRIFILWLSTGGVLAVLLLISIYKYQSNSKEIFEVVGKDVTEQEVMEHSSKKLDINYPKSTNNENIEISLSVDTTAIQSRENKTVDTNFLKVSKKAKASLNNSEEKVNEFDGFEKKTTYHYYSSETDQIISSYNKKWADSIISEKTDVISQKDSIF